MDGASRGGFPVRRVLDGGERVTNMKIERRMEPRRAGDPPSLVADNQRILATLPWRPKRADPGTHAAHRPARPPSLVADNQRILAPLPWRPKRADLDTIVADALAWERRLAERG